MLYDTYTSHWTVTFEQVEEICAKNRLYQPAYEKYAIFRCDWVKGKGGFWWFDDIMELKFFLTHVWPVYNYMSMIFWTEETHVDFHRLQSWYRYWAEMDDAKGAGIVKIVNSYFYGENHVICWTGTLHELESSMEPEPVAVRRSFHNSQSPIKTEQQSDFIKHVSNMLEIDGDDLLTFESFNWLPQYINSLQGKK